MGFLLYLVIAVFLIYLFFMILPVLLPIVLIFIAAVSIYIYFLKRKITKNMKNFDQNMQDFSQTFNDDFNQQDTPRHTNEDIIDVEYTESDDSTV